MTANSANGNKNYEKTKCIICGSGNTSLSERNENFLEMRNIDGNLNEAIDISGIAWEQFPRLRDSSDANTIVNSLMEGLQEKLNIQVLAPISNTTVAMGTMIDRLQDLATRNPTLIEQGFSKTLEGLRTEMNTIRLAI